MIGLSHLWQYILWRFSSSMDIYFYYCTSKKKKKICKKLVVYLYMAHISHFHFFTYECILLWGYIWSIIGRYSLIAWYICVYTLCLATRQPKNVSSWTQTDIFFPTLGWLMTRLEAVSGLMKWRVTGLTYLYNHINYVHLSGGPVWDLTVAIGTGPRTIQTCPADSPIVPPRPAQRWPL